MGRQKKKQSQEINGKKNKENEQSKTTEIGDQTNEMTSVCSLLFYIVET
jgi:hypothetical protein